MEIEKVNIGHKDFAIFKVTYLKAELLSTIQKAREIEGNLNPHAPDGRLRDDDTVSIKNLGGLISEKVVEDLLNKYINDNKIKATVIESNFAELASAEFQVDHAIICGDKTLTIETRSSFSYRTQVCPENVVNYAFQIIGPYVTQNKPIEHPKDFYAFLFYCLHPNLLKQTIDNGHLSIYFAGGATLDMLTQSSTNLEQRGAVYKTVKPIKDGLDANTFFKTLFDI